MPEAIELQREEAVAIVRLNRPERRNALSPAVLEELAQAVGDLDAEVGVRCIVITGTDEVFAAGADIKAMADASYTAMAGGSRRLQDSFTQPWQMPTQPAATL